MKILVTGAKGFIGQNLIERLKENKEFIIFPMTWNPPLKNWNNLQRM